MNMNNENKSGVPGQDIEKKLGTDRIRKNLDVVEEDLVL